MTVAETVPPTTPTPVDRAGAGKTPHLPALDGLRGFAVLLVFFYHYGGGAQSHQPLLRAVGLANKAGWTGVTLFFILSGFLITGILCQSPRHGNSLRTFYMRRVLRIFPLYYFVVFLVLAAAAYQGALRSGVSTVLTLATFTQNFPYFQVHGKVPAPIFHLWSIATEEQFYLLWPALLYQVRSRRSGLRLALGLAVVSFVARLLLWRYAAAPELYAQTLLVRGGELAAGAALAFAARSAVWPAVQRAAPWVGALAAALFAFTSGRAHSPQLEAPIQWVWGLPAVTTAFAALLVMTLTPGLLQRVFSLRPLRFLGRISYGVYVYHFFLLHNVNQAAAGVAHSRQGTAYEADRLLIAIAVTLLVSTLSFYLLERPFLRLKRFYPAQAETGPLLN